MSQFKLSQIREELMKIKDVDSLKKEVKKLIAEIEKFDFKKAIPEARLAYIEKKYKEIMKTINGLQNKAEKEVAGVMKLVKETQTTVAKQKKDLEKLLQSNFNYFSKKAKSSFKNEEKNIKKTIKKVRKTAFAKAKKTFGKPKKSRK